MTELTQLGIGGIFAIMVIREVLSFLRARNGGGPSSIAKQVDDLWTWHNVRDGDGVPVWYVRRSLEESIAKLADSIEKLVEIQRAMSARLSDHMRWEERDHVP